MADLFATALFGGIFGFILVLLSANVIITRRSKGISLGSFGDPLMERRMRAQGNFCEYVPMGLILVAVIELTDVVPEWVVYLLGGVLLVGRLLHATAFFSEHPWMFGRVGGMAFTLTTIGTMAVITFLHGVRLI
eukprot:TRINITY_DN9452_c0_g1_i4.p2 TRINITY_DN9452_c0_g1~~TRINITY_DN9452_c0_g1_i4.p2  ORF type:complete len:134 (-),score=22.20 TRINITY_DN9452_c0_g1_i4:24-425(-)